MGLGRGKKMINEPPLEPLGEEMSPSRRKKMEAIKKVKDFPYCREMRESASPTRFSKKTLEFIKFPAFAGSLGRALGSTEPCPTLPSQAVPLLCCH